MEKIYEIDGGITFTEEDLLEPGERVNPEAIADGIMTELEIDFFGEIRHLPMITPKGQEVLGVMLKAAVERGEL